MAVYVDKPAWQWKGQLWGHLVADSLPELVAFARRLGLHPGWIQLPPKTRYPHYDVNIPKFQKALSLGATLGDKHTIIGATKKCLMEYTRIAEETGSATNAKQAIIAPAKTLPAVVVGATGGLVGSHMAVLIGDNPPTTGRALPELQRLPPYPAKPVPPANGEDLYLVEQRVLNLLLYDDPPGSEPRGYTMTIGRVQYDQIAEFVREQMLDVSGGDQGVSNVEKHAPKNGHRRR